jgi:hypothetical protein
MANLDQEFAAWERLIRERPMRLDREKGILRLTFQNSLTARLAAEALPELWAQKYVQEEYLRLGFSNVEGPFRLGPDFRVRDKRGWALAEVETRWQNYFQHEHHLNREFDRVKYLILLSADVPPDKKRPSLPRSIIHIDRRHFLAWFKPHDAREAQRRRLRLRAEVIVGAMHNHWTEICSDVDRNDSTCPNCDDCAYFGEGIFGEATPFFRKLANQYLVTISLKSRLTEAALTDIDPTSLRSFVEQNPP